MRLNHAARLLHTNPAAATWFDAGERIRTIDGGLPEEALPMLKGLAKNDGACGPELRS